MSSPTSPDSHAQTPRTAPRQAGGTGGRQPTLLFGPFAFDTKSRILRRDSEELPLPPRVLSVLELLLERAGEVVPRQAIIETVWRDAFVTDTSLAEAVSVLRQALGDDSQSPIYVQTLHRRGYRFVAPVSSGEDQKLPAHTNARVSPSIGMELVPWSVAAICALVAVAAVWQATRPGGIAPPSARFVVSPVQGTAFDAQAPALAISDDGALLAWSACGPAGCRLYVRPVDRLDIQAVEGTENAHAPFFSPDGRWIAFFADGRLKKVAPEGGAPIVLADAPSVLGGVWRGEEIIYGGGAAGGLMRVPANGGQPTRLTRAREADGEVRHAWPALVPGRNVLLFTIATTPADESPGLLAALSLDATGRSEAAEWRTLAEGIDVARAAAAETIVFSRGSELHAVRFDPVGLSAAGAPRAVLAGVATSLGRAHYALSNSGSLVYAAPAVPEREPWWWASADPLSAAGDIRRLRGNVLSPDGSRVAGVHVEGNRADVWAADVQRGAATRLTHSGVNASPVWSADGRAIYLAVRNGGAFGISVRDADGVRPAVSLLSTRRHAIPVAASPDGALLAFIQTGEETGADIWAIPTAGGDARSLVQGPFDECAASFSPDSKLLAFQSSESGRWEVYVQRLADGRRSVVSSGGGERPLWTREGLHYQSGSSLMRIMVTDSGDRLSLGAAARIGDLRGASLRGIAPDGRVLVERGADHSNTMLIVGTLWARDLGALLGPPTSALPR